jgi:hypothetical protein
MGDHKLYSPKLRNITVLCKGYVYLNNTGMNPNITIKMHTTALSVPKRILKKSSKAYFTYISTTNTILM